MTYLANDSEGFKVLLMTEVGSVDISHDYWETHVSCHVTDLVSQQLHAPGDVSNEDEVLEGHSSVDVDLRVDEGHAHQVLVVLEIPHEDLRERVCVRGRGRGEVI